MYLPARKPAKSAPSPARPGGTGALQRRADASPAVRQLHRLQHRADQTAPALLVQLYRKQTVKSKDGHFIPSMTAAIHCHVGRQMRAPHLKIAGVVYNFGTNYDDDKLQAAYDALTGDPRNAQLEGYDDCVEYLEDMDVIRAGPSSAGAGAAAAGGGAAAAAAGTGSGGGAADTGPVSAYDDPTTSRESKRLIERGIATGQYPPKS